MGGGINKVSNKNKLISKKTAILFLIPMVIILLALELFVIPNNEEYIDNKLGIFNEITRDRPLTIYLVESISSCCRNFPRLIELIENDSQFIIFVDKDFSIQDMNNLIFEFNFPPDSIINRKGPILDKINAKLNKKAKQQKLNWFFLFSYEGILEDWRYF
jgi:hypothetical protein